MRKTMRLCVAATVYLLALLASQGIAISQERSEFVDTGVIFSVQQIERSDKMSRFFDAAQPLWTPSPEEIARLESTLKTYLEDVASGKRTEVADYWRAPFQAKAIIARHGSYKRQYFGVTHDSKRWIFVNSFCEAYWKRDDSWRDRMALVADGGSCFFMVLYDPATMQFDKLTINGEAG
jgi:hypothetical protein